MATYVFLIKFTEKGVKDIRDICKRAVHAKSDVILNRRCFYLGLTAERTPK